MKGFSSGFLIVFGIIVFASLSFKFQQRSPEDLFNKKCSNCHGKDGAKGALGAKNLQFSKMEDSVIVNTIQNGGKKMPAFKKKLTPEEIKILVVYVKGFRK